MSINLVALEFFQLRKLIKEQAKNLVYSAEDQEQDPKISKQQLQILGWVAIVLSMLFFLFLLFPNEFSARIAIVLMSSFSLLTGMVLVMVAKRKYAGVSLVI